MHISRLLKKAELVLQDNSPSILTALGISGVLTTAYLSFSAGVKVERERPCSNNFTKKEWLEKNWRKLVPVGVSSVLTAGCILGASKASSRRTAAITAAYSISEKAFAEYKDAIVEELGERKEKAVRDKIAQNHVDQAPPSSQVIIGGSGPVICREEFTGRYFNSDIETLRKAVNEINAQLNRDDWAYLSDFYDRIGLASTSHSYYIGWKSGKLLELEVLPALTENGVPCIVFDYKYPPTAR